MNYKKWSFFTLLMFLAACNDETQKPNLDLTGHWNVDHGIYDPCQVNATFTDELLVLTFYSLEEGACQPEQYGIQNNALAIRIDDKQDYFEEDGTLATTLQVSVPEHQAMGTLTLWETDQGLTGDIVSATDPNNLLEPLLEPLYQLTPLSDHWLPLALGKWGASCDQLGFPDHAAVTCELIEISATTSGRIKSYGGSGSGGLDGAVSEIDSMWHNATFALRNLEISGDDTYELDFVMFPEIEQLQSIPMTLTVSDAGMVLDTEGGAFSTPLLLVPVN